MLGGIIERQEPRQNLRSAFMMYQNCFNECRRRSATIKPFGNLWPIYKSPEEFETDYTYTSFLNNETLPNLIKHYMEKEVDMTNALLAVPAIKAIAQEA